MKSGKFIYLAIILTLLLSACASNPAAPTSVPATEKQEEVAASPTTAPTDVPTEEPTTPPTEEPTAEPTEEPTEEPTDTPEADTPTPEPERNARFVPAMPEGNFYMDSDAADDSWKENMEGLARNQAIPKPFEWQLVGVPDETKWSDVFPYFKDYLLEKGWTITADGGDWQTLANGNSMYVGGFIKTVEGKKEKISILFYPKSKQYDGHYRVFYSERK